MIIEGTENKLVSSFVVTNSTVPFTTWGRKGAGAKFPSACTHTHTHIFMFDTYTHNLPPHWARRMGEGSTDLHIRSWDPPDPRMEKPG